MDTNELYLHYREAIQLVKVGRYEEAHGMLAEINHERPNTKNVLYAMAVCADMMGQSQEALEICERLIALFDHPKARLIKARIERASAEPELPNLNLGDTLGIGGPKPPVSDASLPMAEPIDVPASEAPTKVSSSWSWFKKTQ